jgi:ssDNA-binding Zn-finger/Zn-ribbon topoisomerase 1
MKVIIPAGIGLALSIVAAICRNRRRNVAAWMDARRIDRRPDRDRKTCGVCGSAMKQRRIMSGERAGNYLVCSQWPECRKVEKLGG